MQSAEGRRTALHVDQIEQTHLGHTPPHPVSPQVPGAASEVLAAAGAGAAHLRQRRLLREGRPAGRLHHGEPPTRSDIPSFLLLVPPDFLLFASSPGSRLVARNSRQLAGTQQMPGARHWLGGCAACHSDWTQPDYVCHLSGFA